MKPFNLAEGKIAERSYCRKLLIRHLRVMGALAVAALLVAAGSFACKRSIQSKAAHARSELARVQARHKTVESEMSGIKSGLCESKWREQLAEKSIDRLGILSSVLERVPVDMYLSNIECAGGDASLMIEGQAASFELLSAFINRLRRCSRFEEARITNTQIGTSGGISLVDFELNVKLRASTKSGGVGNEVSDIRAGTPAEPAPTLPAPAPSVPALGGSRH